MKKGVVYSFLCFPLMLSLQAQFQVNGSASALGNNCFQITPAQNSQSGNIWATQTISLTQSWDFYLQMQFGCSDGGADGMAFVLQQSGTSATGQVGGAMGFGGISPSLVVEFDTYTNGGFGDLTSDHMGILRNGSNDHTSANSLAGPVNISPSGANVEDCQYHDVHISWDHTTTTIEVYFDCNLRLSYTGNILSTIFNNNPDVFFGFTASTGALNNDHRVCIEFVPGTTRLTDASVCQGDPVSVNVTPGTAFMWTPTQGVSNPSSGTPQLTPDTTTTYRVTITDPCGFTWQDSLTVDVAVVDAGPNQTIGFGQSVQLNSTYIGPPSTGNCNAYQSNSIAYSPYSLNSPNSITLANTGTNFSAAIPLGFPFEFYCNTYTQAYLNTGGYLTFTNGTSNTTPVAIPAFAVPNNLIAYCWSSLDNMTINYETQGTVPNRRFVAEISSIHWFSPSFNPPDGDPVDLQLVLYESGSIEMHITQMNASWFSSMTQGIEGPNGTNGVAITGRNNTFGWSTVNEGIRFEPVPAVVSYSWTPTTNINNPSFEDPTVSPTVDTWYYVTYDDGNCTLTDSVLVSITPLAIDTAVVSAETELPSFQINPNPHTGVFYISGWEETADYAEIELYNLKGQKVFGARKEIKTAFSSWEVKLDNLPKGLYLYRFHAGNEWHEGKMMIRD